ncbi:hypothetical protein CBU02nite_31940 [Clostridium butyricum]|uniref:N-acetyltransferase domain-containing protein n=1 Tax=Clostridium butyricum TaxID=1492 RepID=A0A512TRR6_CLOBU|nr:GNAT family N-acetyltransferase [Clostridium butyricum]NOW21822.1 putative acetyltransferase [Clostridium butyricum]GEQ22688.1 hypothetical protein CBU02nite_31940 [Clostridium butyricum]
MYSIEDLKLETLRESDIEVLTPIMKRAFDEDSRLHLGELEGGPEGYDNGEFLRKFALDKNSTSFKVLLNNKIIGAVILWINNKTNENFLGNIFLDLNTQNSGIGKDIWKMIEDMFPNTKIWRTETPGFSRRNHYFYVMKCGFKIIKIENPMDKYECNYIMEKEM